MWIEAVFEIGKSFVFRSTGDEATDREEAWLLFKENGGVPYSTDLTIKAIKAKARPRAHTPNRKPITKRRNKKCRASKPAVPAMAKP